LINFQIIDSVETCLNNKGRNCCCLYKITYNSYNSYNFIGVLSLSAENKIFILAFPDKNNGFIQVKNYEKSTTTLIKAFESKAISNICLNNNGSLLATISDEVSIE